MSRRFHARWQPDPAVAAKLVWPGVALAVAGLVSAHRLIKQFDRADLSGLQHLQLGRGVR